MEKPNLILLVLLVSNLILLFCLDLINSTVGSWGFFLYVPALFFLPATLFLERLRALILLFLTGLLYDLSIHSTLGFHGFCLCTAYLIWQEIFKLGRKGLAHQPVSLQLGINLLFGVMWALYAYFFSSFTGVWEWSRIAMDLIFSSLLIIPIGIWFPRFCTSFTELFQGSPYPKHSK